MCGHVRVSFPAGFGENLLRPKVVAGIASFWPARGLRQAATARSRPAKIAKKTIGSTPRKRGEKEAHTEAHKEARKEARTEKKRRPRLEAVLQLGEDTVVRIEATERDPRSAEEDQDAAFNLEGVRQLIFHRAAN
mgnify:CR=1 FL=1